jgi:Dullard-like phosphatase family protein
MDETLIRANLNPKVDEKFDYNIALHYKRQDIKVGVHVRPFLKEVLRQLRYNFELILFTSGTRSYARAILNSVIESDEDFFDHVITREHCLYDTDSKITIKDLNILLGSRSLKNVIIVDNSSKCYLKNIENGIPITSFTGAKNDKVLLLLRNYLYDKILSCDDVREVLKRDFKLLELK